MTSINTLDTDPAGDNRPPVYFEPDGTMVIRASALGTSCLFELAAAGQGYGPDQLPPALVRAFADGHALEPVVLERMVDEEDAVHLATQEEGHLLVLVATRDGAGAVVKVRFHTDALTNLGSRFWLQHGKLIPDHERDKGRDSYTVVTEVKAIADAGWQQAVSGTIFDYMDHYAWQFSVMMLGSGLPLVGAYYNKGLPEQDIDGIKQRPLCADQGNIHYEYFTEPPVPFEYIQAKVQQVYDLVTGEDVVQSGFNCTDPSQWPCRFSHIRPESDEAEDGGYRELPPDQVEEFEQLVREYVAYKGQEDEAKALRTDRLERIVDIIGKGKQTIVTDRWVVPMVKGTSNNVAWKDVPKELKEKVDKYKKKSYYYYLRDIKRRD